MSVKPPKLPHPSKCTRKKKEAKHKYRGLSSKMDSLMRRSRRLKIKLSLASGLEEIQGHKGGLTRIKNIWDTKENLQHQQRTQWNIFQAGRELIAKPAKEERRRQ